MRALLIAGPSGVGKSYLARFLSERGRFMRIVPHTTRAKRNGEISGVNYYYVNDLQFETLQREGAFFMANEFLGSKYAYASAEVERIHIEQQIPITEIFPTTIAEFKASIAGTRAVYLYTRDFDFLRTRMLGRGDSALDVEKRILSAHNELKFVEENTELFDELIEVSEETDFQEIIHRTIGESNDEFKINIK